MASRKTQTPHLALPSINKKRNNEISHVGVQIALHPPNTESSTELFMSGVRANVPDDVRIPRGFRRRRRKDVVQKVDVSSCELQGLNFRKFVGRKRGDALAQTCESFVETLRALPFPHVGHYPLVLDVFEALRGFPPRLAPGGLLAGVFVVGFEALPLPPRSRFRRGVHFLFRFHFDEGHEVVGLLRFLVVWKLHFALVLVEAVVINVHPLRFILR